MAEPVEATPDFTCYQDLLKFVIHHANICHHVPLSRLAQYAAIPFSRLDECRKIRTDRKQLELTYSEHVKLVCTLFELKAPKLAMLMLRWGVDSYVRIDELTFDAKEIRKHVTDAIDQLQTVRAKL